jgi:hypothetical protein
MISTTSEILMRYAGVVLGVLLIGTGSAGARQAKPTSPASPAFVGKTWVSTDPAAAAGTLRIFLSDGTLIMDSCVETYRLARWRALNDRRIEWTEDDARIQADVTQVTADQLRLRLQLGSDVKEESYRLARVPFTCPDLRSTQSGSRMTGAPVRGMVTPSPGTYRCGEETFKVSFDERRAFVTMPDGSLVTLERRTGGKPEQSHTFTNGRLTFVQEAAGASGPRILFARGRMLPSPCTRQ